MTATTLYVVDTESDTPAVIGTFITTEEDVVVYRRPDGTTGHAPVDCVAITTTPDRRWTEMVDQYNQIANIYRRNARESLIALIDDATTALAMLDDGRVRSTIGGSVLNAQLFNDAERNLVRWWDARGVVATIEPTEDDR